MSDIITGSFRALLKLDYKKEEKITKNYNFEPDKVRVAEIEKETQTKIKELENEGITIKKDAMKELLREMGNLQMEIMRAKQENFSELAKNLPEISKLLGEYIIGKYASLEKLSIDVQQFIISKTTEIEKQLTEDLELYDTKLKNSLNQLNIYEKDSDAYNIYKKSVESFLDIQVEKIRANLEYITNLRNSYITSSLNAKDTLMKHLADLNNKVIGIIGDSKDLVENDNLLPNVATAKNLLEDNSDR